MIDLRGDDELKVLGWTVGRIEWTPNATATEKGFVRDALADLDPFMIDPFACEEAHNQGELYAYEMVETGIEALGLDKEDRDKIEGMLTGLRSTVGVP